MPERCRNLIIPDKYQSTLNGPSPDGMNTEKFILHPSVELS